jgi:hypothetical protein
MGIAVATALNGQYACGVDLTAFSNEESKLIIVNRTVGTQLLITATPESVSSIGFGRIGGTFVIETRDGASTQIPDPKLMDVLQQSTTRACVLNPDQSLNGTGSVPYVFALRAGGGVPDAGSSSPPALPTTETDSAARPCASEAPVPVSRSERPFNKRISNRDRHALGVALSNCRANWSPTEAIPGSVYFASYGGYDWAVASFRGLIGPEVFTRRNGSSIWSDDGMTLGQVCEHVAGNGDGYVLPAALGRIWRFKAQGHGCFAIPSPTG